MNRAATFATARRVLTELRRDPRTLALIIAVPIVLLTLVRWVFHSSPQVFQSIGAAVLGIMPFAVMFVIASVTTLHERTTGTLERLLTMPVNKIDLLAGYAFAFGAVAAVQVAVCWTLAVGPLGLEVAGASGLLFVVAFLGALLGMALGLLCSAFATTEFQAVQFMPAVVFPQLLLCGLFAPREQMAEALHWISNVLPLSYAVDAMRHLTTSGTVDGGFVADLAVMAGVVVAGLVLGAATLRRRTA